MKDNKLLAAMLAAAAMLGDKEAEAPKQGKSMREQAKELGELMKETMLGFVDAGFTREEAFRIILTIKGGN